MMKKIFLIGWKDLTLAFRDRTGLTLMLVAPFLLTVGLGFVTGRLSGSNNAGIGEIPVIIVNADGAQLGDALVELFQSPELADLVAVTLMDDAAQARGQVDADAATAAVIVPAGFTASIIPAAGQPVPTATVMIGLYINPSRPTGAGVVKTILDEFISRLEIGRVAGRIAVTQMLDNGLISGPDAAAAGAQIGARLSSQERTQPITLRSVTSSGQAVRFDPLAYMAPGMALLFLMYTVTNGGRILLAERSQGTLPRLLISPTTTVQVLGGKTLGVFLTGLAQMLILIVASALLFRLDWGAPPAVFVLTTAAVFGAVGWGMLITAVAQTPGQVSTIGSALMLLFGIMGGSFISLEQMPGWFAALSKITPNAWGLDGFTTLALGGDFGAILTPTLALLAMGALLFAVAALLFNRRGFAQR